MARKHWWVKHPVQAKFMSIVSAAILAPTLIVGAGLYYLVFSLLEKQLAFPEAIMANLAPVIQRVNLWLFLTLPFLILGLWWIALVMTHRFAGPIERIEKELDRAIRGEKTGHRIRLRRHDDLRGIADRINTLLDKSRS